MRLVDAFRVKDGALVTGSPDEQLRAWREHQRAQIARAIVTLKEEIPRNELDFGALGGRVIEHLPSGDFYVVFRGDASYTGDDVRHYFTNSAGAPVMLQRATPANRREMENKRTARAQWRADREAELRQRRDDAIRASRS
jgi:hypothetical protein